MSDTEGSKQNGDDANGWEPLPAPAVNALNRALDDLERERRIAAGDLSAAFARTEDKYRQRLQAIALGEDPYAPEGPTDAG